MNWADEDPGWSSFIRVNEEEVQVELLNKISGITTGDEPPAWIKWHIGSQEARPHQGLKEMSRHEKPTNSAFATLAEEVNRWGHNRASGVGAI